MDLQTAFNIVLSAAAFLGGWVLNTMWAAIKDMQKSDKDLADKVAEIQVLVAGNYLPRSEYRADIMSVHEALLRIENKLDGKADK
jgi:hypothetical protein